MNSPVKKEFITQDFGKNPENYAKFGLKGHNGIDFRAFLPNGERCYVSGKSEVFAPHEGIILENASDFAGYGNYVKIENALEGSVLAHFSGISSLAVGSTVRKGDFIGFQGTTGNSTGIHLHWGYYKKPRKRNNGYNGYINQAGLYVSYKEIMPDNALSECLRQHTDLVNQLEAEKRKNDALEEQLKDKELENDSLRGEVAEKASALKTVREELSGFAGTLATKLTTIEDKSEIIGAVDRLLSGETDYIKKVRNLEKAYVLLEDEKKVEIESLKRSIEELRAVNEELRAANEDQAKHIGTLEVRLTNLETRDVKTKSLYEIIKKLFERITWN